VFVSIISLSLSLLFILCLKSFLSSLCYANESSLVVIGGDVGNGYWEGEVFY
jgi:hypothetical protein